MFTRFELLIAGFSVTFLALAMFLLQRNISSQVPSQSTQQLAQTKQSAIEFMLASNNTRLERTVSDDYLSATDENGNVIRMVIDDIKQGNGVKVSEGDTILVHYTVKLPAGQEFANSRKQGEPLRFTVGRGEVIKGWEEGLIGMQVGGERILVVPPEKAYGQAGNSLIPSNATLVFKVELLDIING
jgi:FKBP-type peptidyl-prolyl cis-trans isomerase